MTAPCAAPVLAAGRLSACAWRASVRLVTHARQRAGPLWLPRRQLEGASGPGLPLAGLPSEIVARRPPRTAATWAVSWRRPPGKTAGPLEGPQAGRGERRGHTEPSHRAKWAGAALSASCSAAHCEARTAAAHTANPAHRAPLRASLLHAAPPSQPSPPPSSLHLPPRRQRRRPSCACACACACARVHRESP